MPRVLFLSHDGVEYPVDAHAGDSLMAAALDNAVPGIDAECGGGCACGTCRTPARGNPVRKQRVVTV